MPPPPPFNFTDYRRKDSNDSIVVIANDSSGSSADRNPFTDWLQGILGRPTTTDKPVNLDPPVDCDDCSKFQFQIRIRSMEGCVTLKSFE